MRTLHAVDLPARRDRLGDEPRRVLARGALDRPRALVGLELDPARPRELGGEPAATTSPPRRIATRSHTSSISESRCELSRTETPRPRSSSSRRRTVRRPTGSSADVGSSSSEQPRLADERLRDAEPLLHPLRHAVDAAVGGVGERDELEQPLALRGAAARAAEPLVQLEHLVRRVPAREAEELGEVAELRARGALTRRARRDLGRCRASARTRPTAIFTSVDLPAPFGPSSPTSSPSADLEVDALERLDGAVALLERRGRRGQSARTSVRHYVPPCRADTWRVLPPKRPSGARTRRRAREATSRRRRRSTPPSTAARRTIPSRTSSAGADEVDPGRALRVGQGVGRHGAPRRRRGLASELLDRRDELVDRQRGQRLDLRRSAGAERDRDARRSSPCPAPRRR